MYSNNLTKEVYKAAQSGLTAIQTVMPKIQNSALQKQVERQGVALTNFVMEKRR